MWWDFDAIAGCLVPFTENALALIRKQTTYLAHKETIDGGVLAPGVDKMK